MNYNRWRVCLEKRFQQEKFLGLADIKTFLFHNCCVTCIRTEPSSHFAAAASRVTRTTTTFYYWCTCCWRFWRVLPLFSSSCCIESSTGMCLRSDKCFIAFPFHWAYKCKGLHEKRAWAHSTYATWYCQYGYLSLNLCFVENVYISIAAGTIYFDIFWLDWYKRGETEWKRVGRDKHQQWKKESGMVIEW